MMSPGDRLTLSIEKAVAGGRMLARHEGAVVLVAAAIPGETVEAEVEKVQRGTIWATTRRVIEPSVDRVLPFCDWACGGTVYAHVRYQRQLDLKREVLADAFARIARVPVPRSVPVAASRPEGYRMRARLHLRGGRIGFFREGTHDLCDAATTRQLLPESLETLAELERAVAKEPRVAIREVEIAENCAATERALHLELDADADRSRLAAATAIAGVNGISCGAPQRSRALTLWGSPVVTDTVGGVVLARHAHAFFQGNRYLLGDLVAHVLNEVPCGSVLDLYAGVGLFSAPLAARGDTQVVAVEGDPVSADDLKRNLAPVARTSTARHQSVEAYLAGARRERVAAVLVDPPRTGMTRDALQGIFGLGVPRLVYVSCDVATLARDVRTLSDRGYQLASLAAFDMFPNTAHVETVATLDKR